MDLPVIRALVEQKAIELRTRNQSSFSRDLNHVALGLAGEAGEFADAIKKADVYGRPFDATNAAEELADLLFYVDFGAKVLGLTLSDLEDLLIRKLATRFKEGFTLEEEQERDPGAEAAAFSQGLGQKPGEIHIIKGGIGVGKSIHQKES